MDSKIMVLAGDLKFTELTVPAKGRVHRDPAAGMVRATGHTVLNAAGTDAMREVIRLSDFTGDSVALTAAVNEKTGVIALYVSDPGTLGSVVCRFRKDSNRTVFHLSGVFEAYPGLRVSNRTFCPVKVAKDSTDKPCLAVALKGTYQTGRRSRTSRASDTSSAK